jgi:hypothetical protein
MKKNLTLTFIILFFGAINGQCDKDLVYNTKETNAVCIETVDNVINVYTNNYPDHDWGNWPSNSPVIANGESYHVCQNPIKSDTSTSMYDSGADCSRYVQFGIGLNGIFYAGWGAKWFVNPETNEENRDWNVDPIAFFNVDYNGAHSNGQGEFHYHGTPKVYFQETLKIDGNKHSPHIGYAADGFPIYYKYAYTDPMDPNSGITSFSSGYSLKSGTRPGDGITEPNGEYDGLYVEDFEYITDASELDDCNGRFGKTPEYPNGTYYYVLTDSWPYFPRCFYGTVIDNSFRIGSKCGESNAATDCSPTLATDVQLLDNLKLTIYPNPTGSYIIIKGSEFSKLNINAVSVYDTTGKILYTSKEIFERIDLSFLKAGNYFIQISAGNAEITRKIIKR